MSKIAVSGNTDFDKDVLSYKQKEAEVGQTLILGIRDLGLILEEKRDKWKEKGRWGEYLEKIGRSQAWANQCIRIAEYSQTNMKALLNADLTKWRRVNDFIALPDAMKKEVSKRIDGESVSDSDFKEVVEGVKDDLSDEVPEEITRTPKAEAKILDAIILPKSVQKTISSDVEESAKEILKEMQEGNEVFTKASEDFVSALLHVNMGIKELQKLAEKNKLSDDEKSYWKRTISLAAKTLKDVSTVIGQVEEAGEDAE